MKAPSSFKLIMISAMNENGGNTLHRFFDGHPQLFTYPFESQIGTYTINDYLSSVFPSKYRYSDFLLDGNFENDYELIVDEELKRHVKTPEASKFKNADLGFKDSERKKQFLELLKGKKRTRANIVEAFFRATFLAWKTYKFSGKEQYYLGYSPIIGVDTEKILTDFPDAIILHIVRNPYSAFSDTQKRPVPYSLERYINTWNIVQLHALSYAKMFPKNFILVRFEDMVENPKKFFTFLCNKINLPYENSFEYPSWNGVKMESVSPWGVIKEASTTTNQSTGKKLTKNQIDKIKLLTSSITPLLGYDK